VRWAFALIRRDVEEKAIRVTANRENDASGLFAKIAALIGDDDGETLGVIKNRLRRTHKPEDIEKALAHMVEKGVIEAQVQPGGKGKGRPGVRYRMI
jgi:predicted HTH transcriptional regulator